MTISLGGPLPVRSSSLPETQQKRAASGRINDPTSSLLGLAPDGGYLAAALLPAPVGSYPTVSPLPFIALSFGKSNAFGGLFLWPDPIDYSTPGVTRHLTLRSADFPRPGTWPGRDHPTSLRIYIIPLTGVSVKQKDRSRECRPAKLEISFILGGNPHKTNTLMG